MPRSPQQYAEIEAAARELLRNPMGRGNEKIYTIISLAWRAEKEVTGRMPQLDLAAIGTGLGLDRKAMDRVRSFSRNRMETIRRLLHPGRTAKFALGPHHDWVLENGERVRK